MGIFRRLFRQSFVSDRKCRGKPRKSFVGCYSAISRVIWTRIGNWRYKVSGHERRYDVSNWEWSGSWEYRGSLLWVCENSARAIVGSPRGCLRVFLRSNRDYDCTMRDCGVELHPVAASALQSALDFGTTGRCEPNGNYFKFYLRPRPVANYPTSPIDNFATATHSSGRVLCSRLDAEPVCKSAAQLIAKLLINGDNRPYHNFAPFVRQTGERKAQTCVMGYYVSHDRFQFFRGADLHRANLARGPAEVG
jgi:hypothetical protein